MATKIYKFEQHLRDMNKITPCLWFDNNAEEAARFYISVFKNSKIKQIMHYGDSGAKASGQKKGTVAMVVFELDGQEFMGLNGGPAFTFSEAISLMVNCKDQKEIDYFWEKLSAGGEKSVCGWVKDKYGLSWQIIPDTFGEMMKDPVRAERVMSVVMKSTKPDLKKMQDAAEGK